MYRVEWQLAMPSSRPPPKVAAALMLAAMSSPQDGPVAAPPTSHAAEGTSKYSIRSRPVMG